MTLALNSLGLAIIILPSMFLGFVFGRRAGYNHGYQTGSRARAKHSPVSQ